MRLVDRIEEARASHDIRSILGTNKKSIVCPLPYHVHKNNSPSFSIHWIKGVQYFKCHGNCGLEGDVIDLVGYLRIPGYDKKDIKLRMAALELLDQRYEIQIVIPEREVALNGAEWMDFVPIGPEAAAYAARRGLSDETIERFRLGQHGHYLVMPAFEEGLLRGVKFRNIYQIDRKHRFWQLEGSRLALFNYDAVYLTMKPVLIVKGEIPTMLLTQLGFLACSPTAGEGSYKQTERWRTALALSPRKVVVGDNDKAGLEGGRQRATLLNAELRFPPEGHDIDSWILADRENAIRTLHQWLEDEHA